MLIPSPTGFFVLKVSRILVHAFLASHLSSEGFGEFQGVSGGGDEAVLGGFFVVPSRYPVMLFNAAIDIMLVLQVGQFVLSNLSASLNIGGILCPAKVMLGFGSMDCCLMCM